MNILHVNEYDSGLKVPPNNTRVARYISYSKLKCLVNGELYFCNCEKFYDDNERKVISLGKYSNELGLNIASKLDKHEKQQCSAYASCWTKCKYENVALWKIYDPDSNGVCVVTTIGKLRKQLGENVLIGEVVYEKEGGVPIPFISIDKVCCNYMGTEFLKIAPYSYENEIRAVFYSNENTHGEVLHINFNLLVEEVYLSPFASDYNKQVAKKLLLEQIEEDKIKNSVIRESAK